MLLIKLIIFMQTFITKNLKYICLSISIIFTCTAGTSLANTHFSELFLVEPATSTELADRIAMYHSENIEKPVTEQITELTNINSKLKAAESKFSNKPLYWFIQGLNHSNLASAYNSNKQQHLTQQHLDLKNQAYKRAISLDSNRNKLSAAIYSTMKYGLSDDLKIIATQNELALGGNGYSDSYYWYLHWSNIDQLKKAGRNDEAEEAYQNMMKELNESDMDVTVYSTLTRTIEQQTLQKKPAIKPETDKKAVEKKPKPVPDENKLDNKTLIIIALVISAIIALTVVTIYELVIRKKRRKR